MKTAVQIVEGIIDLIADKKHWTQGSYARVAADKSAPRVRPDSDLACAFCSVGAGAKAANCEVSDFENSEVFKIILRAFYGAACDLFGVEQAASIVPFNDNHSHEDVMAVWNKTLQNLKMMEDLQ